MLTRIIAPALCVLIVMLQTPGAAEEVLVAQAANFSEPMEEIARKFEQATGHRVRISAGSTGKLYAQIQNGAPFDLFLAADQRRPRLLEEEGLAVAGSRFTYALGRLTLWSRDADRVTGDGTAVLRRGDFDYLAIANPKTAPFGSAAVQVMHRLGLEDRLSNKIVQGENVAQAFQFVFSGNAQLGFLSLSQVLDPRVSGAGSRWDVPQDLYDPLKMDAVLLSRSERNPAALALLDYLKGGESQAIMERYGYGRGR